MGLFFRARFASRPPLTSALAGIYYCSASSMRAVKSMPVGPVVAFSDSPDDPLALASTSTSTSPMDREAREAAAAVEAVRRLEAASASTAPSSRAEAPGAAGVALAGTAADRGKDEGQAGGGIRGKLSAKERSRSVALSPGCRRCLNCEALYDLVRHASEFGLHGCCSRWRRFGCLFCLSCHRSCVSCSTTYQTMPHSACILS